MLHKQRQENCKLNGSQFHCNCRAKEKDYDLYKGHFRLLLHPHSENIQRQN